MESAPKTMLNIPIVRGSLEEFISLRIIDEYAPNILSKNLIEMSKNRLLHFRKQPSIFP